MALIDMAQELTGRIPNLDIDLAVTMVREAWHYIRKARGFSFQLGQGGWSVPSQLDAGTCSVAFGSPSVTGDSVASAAWLSTSQYGSLITQRQFRIGGSQIYNIIALDSSNPSAVVLTLDRPWIDPLVNFSGLEYIIYQPYVVTPVKEFIRWLAFRDMTNVRWLNINSDYAERRVTDMADPQRQIYTPPLMVLPFYTDQRPASSTLGWKVFELYPQPTSQISYQWWWEWEGPDLVNPTDTLPYPITERLVKAQALVDGYTWAEANKDPQNPRGFGADFRFLSQFWQKVYADEFQKVRVQDRETVDMFTATMTRTGSPAPFSVYNPSTGVLSVSNLAQTS